jgi:predicted nucleotidyltransferase component of viral defense system
MDNFARRSPEDRQAFLEEAAARRDVTATVVEKDLWVCWTLRRLMEAGEIAGHLTFKGGTSLSKSFGIIARFSEDIDLVIRHSAPIIDKVASPMKAGISGNERQRRTKALKAAARQFVSDVAMPALASCIKSALGTTDGWSLALDPEDPDQQALLFHYPRAIGGTEGGAEADEGGYIKPRIKLEFGARGEGDPFEAKRILPYVAEEFPEELPDASTEVPTLAVERTYWEKATILHALQHNGKLREGLSRHYYDLVMLDRAGVTAEAVKKVALLASVVHNKETMFADNSASYETAVPGTLRLRPTGALEQGLKRDYAAMAEMFMAPAPTFETLMEELAAIEAKLNADTA